MKKIFLIIILATIFIVGCEKGLDESAFEGNVEVQGFVVKHPEARTDQIYFSRTQVTEIIEFLQEKCGENMQISDYYLQKALDTDTGEYVNTWVDANTGEVVCTIKSRTDDIPSIIGNVVASVITPNIIEEEEVVGKPVSIGAIRKSVNHAIMKDVLQELLKGDDDAVLINPTKDGPIHNIDEHLQLGWAAEVDKLSILMKGSNGNPYFELWTEDEILVSSGRLDNEYRWYSFDVSSNGLRSKSYALYNYDFGGSGDILVDKVVGDPIVDDTGFADITAITGNVVAPMSSKQQTTSKVFLAIFVVLFGLLVYLRTSAKKKLLK